MKKAIFFLMLLLVFFSTVEALASSSYLFYVKNDGSAGTWTNLNIYRSDADGTNPVQLTSGAGVNVLPRVNATQTKLVFLSNRSGKYQVYTMGIDGSGVKQLTTSGVSGGQNNGGPGGVCWTPDGKILYINATKISRMNDDGTGVTEIATAPSDNWSDIRCSPTGNKIAAQTQAGWAYIMSIYIMNMDGSGMTKLVPDDPGGQSLGSFSKDGLTLYYGYDVSGHEESSGLNLDHQIYSIKIDGTAKTQISVNKPSGYNDSNPVVAGSKIYFNYEQAINNAPGSEVWRMNLDGSQREQVISGVYAYYPEIVEGAPTSSYLFYVKNDGSAGTWTNLNIYRSNADGTNPLQLTSGAGVNVLPRVNATQTKLVFLSNRSGKYQVYTMGIDGSGVKQLTTSGVSGGQNNGGPGGVCWTPDGKILYINATKISRMNDDGTGVTEIATAPIDNWSDIRCSPTGNKIAAQTQGGWGYTLSIYIMNMDGSGMTKLVPDDPGGQSLGSFSKDGLTLYYGYDVSGHEESSGLNLDHQIYSIKIDGTAKTKISVNKPSGYNDIRPVVAGSKIYFNYEQAINNAPASEVWRMNLDGSQREQVISGVYAYYPEIVEAVPTSVSENSGQPRGFVLSQNYPNPFNPTTIISYIVPHQAHVTLEIYDGLGRQVTTLVNEIQSPGPRSIMWNGEAASGRRVASGVYYYRLNAGSFVETKKMILLK